MTIPYCSFIQSPQVRVSCRAEELLGRLQAAEEVNAMVGTVNRFLWRPEFAAYMVEGTPGVHTEVFVSFYTTASGVCFNVVEANMIVRRMKCENYSRKTRLSYRYHFPLWAALISPTLPCDRLPVMRVAPGRSIFWPEDAVYCGHPRFKNLVKNIRGRRGRESRYQCADISRM
ncbi:hypothetical protein KIN20_029988 [Parelaphostrongylus tenuis]|uniref:Glutamate--cysteine ligase n=1 Tax=Parelaphostrongylus tenuis TaxID=148309 RepID=A0AAD5R343_PARTN|nr:hypothetical protein KIN20_029988 [Parelaphostrongylus tenuis]